MVNLSTKFYTIHPYTIFIDNIDVFLFGQLLSFCENRFPQDVLTVPGYFTSSKGSSVRHSGAKLHSSTAIHDNAINETFALAKGEIYLEVHRPFHRVET